METTTKMFEEGYSTKRPPLFNGKFFAQWKKRMEIFIKAENYQAWCVIEIGDLQVTKKNDKGKVVPKPLLEYNGNDYRKSEINALAEKLLHCGLGPSVHNLVMGCKNAKQIWDFLQIMYEGTSEMKKAKIDLLKEKYERFQMSPEESIQDMLARFFNIINELASLGKVITADEQVKKMFGSVQEGENWYDNILVSLEIILGNCLEPSAHEFNMESWAIVDLALMSAEPFYSRNSLEFVMLERAFKNTCTKMFTGDQKRGNRQRVVM